MTHRRTIFAIEMTDKSLIHALVILVVSVWLSGCDDVDKAKVLLPPSWIGMDQIAPDVYVDAEMDSTQRERLLTEVSKAKGLVKAVWGRVDSTPVIHACSTRRCAEAMGIGARAHQLLGHIVLSPKALTKELISHEWSHAELYRRVEGFFAWRAVPRWFDEGVAVLVSHEPRHDERAWEQIIQIDLPYPSTDGLVTSRQWNEATRKYNKHIEKDDIVITYALAGHVVDGWYRSAGSEGLDALIDGVSVGRAFDKSFAMYGSPASSDASQ